MWVKICANTDLVDAMRAAELGADAVGFVFAPSKRQVTVAQVAEITARLTLPVERIGVFDSRDAAAIASAAQTAGLTAVQLHSAFDPELVEALRGMLPADVDVIPTLQWEADGVGSSADEVAAGLRSIAATGLCRRVLIDSKIGGMSGGTGVAFDWSAARQVFLEGPPGLKLILAGGLTPKNVCSAIAALEPWGVDVASGVESSAGRKDPEKMAGSYCECASRETVARAGERCG